ncbi:two-component sensor histidine kinase [Sporosarcina sp. NCCP-2378]|nr:two-component sensor histidine kinase [Sporosarcina sp. NCCP-2378]
MMASGSNHRDVLSEYYSDITIKHIVLMEKNRDREVIITDSQGSIIQSSKKGVAKYLTEIKRLDSRKDQVIVSDWEKSPYIISAHPYQVNGQHSGFVIMFQGTEPLEQLVSKLNLHFGLAGVTSVIALFIIYAFLSKFLTRPLIRMKEATEKLSKGDFNVSLPFISKDELGELSVSIQKLANDLERLKGERNEFLASVAHELSTPLTYLIGYSKVAMRPEVDEKERKYYLEIIKEESNRMKDLVKNLLDLAKMDENTFTVTKSSFFVRPFFDEVCTLVQPSFELKNVTLDFICNENFELYADPLRLEQIVLNLLDNALKYSYENSKITLKVCKVGDKTSITVTDAGLGIPAEELEFIFEKLYRIEKSRSRTFGGSGIGLAIVKELVEAHGGTVEVQSIIGLGSSFTINI